MTTTEALQEALRHMEWAADHLDFAQSKVGNVKLASAQIWLARAAECARSKMEDL